MSDLWCAVFIGGARKNDPTRNDHEVIVQATTEDDAVHLAKDIFFNRWGGYVRQYAANMVQYPYSEPRYVRIRKLPESTVIINGEILENPYEEKGSPKR